MSVLAVMVLYRCGLDQAGAWPGLCRIAAKPAGDDVLVLQHVLVYDNSPVSAVRADELPGWASLVHDGSNGGTASAYRHAQVEAERRGVRWLLLLDQDSELPPDLLSAAQVTLRDGARAAAAQRVAAILPRVSHRGKMISPARVSRLGSIKPISGDEGGDSGLTLTGIASGALLRVDAFRSIGPLPPELWLDYVDHWIFAKLHRAGYEVGISRAELHHDLSLERPDLISDQRLSSILTGEAAYFEALPWTARLLHPWRLLWRAVRPSALSMHQRLLVLASLRRRHGPRR